MKYSSLRQIPAIVGCIFLLLTCTACNPISKTFGSATITLTPKTTRVHSQITPMVSIGNPIYPGFTLFTNGDGYTIAVPKGWDIVPSVNIHAINFDYVDNSHDDEFYVDATLPNMTTHPNLQTTPLHTIATNYIQDYLQSYPHRGLLPGYHNLNVAATRNVNGVLWSQVIVDTPISAAAVQYRLVCLVTKYPSKEEPNKLIVLFYFTSVQDFETVSTWFFEPMIQSFRFTSFIH